MEKPAQCCYLLLFSSNEDIYSGDHSSKVSEKQMYYTNELSLTMTELLLVMWFML